MYKPKTVKKKVYFLPVYRKQMKWFFKCRFTWSINGRPWELILDHTFRLKELISSRILYNNCVIVYFIVIRCHVVTYLVSLHRFSKFRKMSKYRLSFFGGGGWFSCVINLPIFQMLLSVHILPCLRILFSSPGL